MNDKPLTMKQARRARVAWMLANKHFMRTREWIVMASALGHEFVGKAARIAGNARWCCWVMHWK